MTIRQFIELMLLEIGFESTVLPWPPKGADMNAIENIWGGGIVKDKGKVIELNRQTRCLNELLVFGRVTNNVLITGEN